MAYGDVFVDRLGDDWAVTIEGVAGWLPYDNRTDAVEAGRRAAQLAGSRLTVNLGWEAAEVEMDHVAARPSVVTSAGTGSGDHHFRWPPEPFPSFSA
jgi:hypothetical protein